MIMKVLVVDDEWVICTSCEKVIRKDGHEVHLAITGKEALQLINQEPFDIVFTDLRMMDIGGMDLLRTIKEKYPEIIVVIITGYATIASAVETMKLGAFDYLPKPFTADELLAVLRRAVEKRKLIEIRVSEPIPDFGNMIGKSPKMQEVFSLIEKVAPTDSTVMILGESGTGKELVARAIHEQSPRKGYPFVAVDSATLTSNLMESELFGHVRGSFTGAVTTKPGLFEVANHGTIFLDEIGNIDLDVQGKLLRTLQEHEILPVGGTKPKSIDTRFIFATNRDLKEMVASSQFRDDLYYRVFVFPIQLPGLRERTEDIPFLAYYFLKKYAEKARKKIAKISDTAMEMMVEYSWPGNVRQLEHVIERLVIVTDDETISTSHLPSILHLEEKQPIGTQLSIPQTNQELKQLKKELRLRAIEDIEKSFITEALNRNTGNVTKAADAVGMQRTNFQGLMKKYGIRMRIKDVNGESNSE
jgi:DNA-binding NtrC family response regulator